jgi:hypothetical protein
LLLLLSPDFGRSLRRTHRLEGLQPHIEDRTTKAFHHISGRTSLSQDFQLGILGIPFFRPPHKFQGNVHLKENNKEVKTTLSS